MLRPLGDSILFIFNDEFTNNGFKNVTDSGIIYKTQQDSAGAPRWGKVVAVGNKVKEIKPGMTVLIEPLRWTEGFKIDDVKIWKTVEKEIMAVREEA
jgi:co-chaperonin GroES (HSP10)